MYSYIAIEGVIGAGKTTIAKFLADKLLANLLLEEFEDNPFLPKFYQEPDKFAFPLEMGFLASRYHQVKKVVENRNLFETRLISDFVLYKSLVFASINLKEDEAILYRKLFDIMFLQIPVPDLTIYIHHSIENLKKNILKRGRVYEQNLSSDYLEALNENYLNYFKQLKDHRILILDGKQFDVEKNPSAWSMLNEILQTDFPLGISTVT